MSMEATQHKPQVAVERLDEAIGPSGDVYRLIRFHSGEYAVVRNDVPLVRCGVKKDATESFKVLTRARPQSAQRRRRRRRR
jgi:hypothetical protein